MAKAKPTLIPASHPPTLLACSARRIASSGDISLAFALLRKSTQINPIIPSDNIHLPHLKPFIPAITAAGMPNNNKPIITIILLIEPVQ